MSTSDCVLEIKDKDSLKSGDIVLCHGYNPKGLDPGIDGVIEFFTHSPWEHVAMIIKNPSWIDASLSDGLYIYQSGTGPNSYPDVINGNLRGVTLNHLDDFLANRQHIYIRSLENFTWDKNAKEKFLKAFAESHGKPYDTNWWNWFCTGINSFFCYGKCKLSNCCVKRHTNNFWCSALISYMYVKMGLFPESLDWSEQTPVFFANDDVPIVEPYSLSKLWILRK